MSTEIIIGISVAIAVAVIVGVHGWLHKLVKFKMDEGVILKFFRESSENTEHTFRSSETIAAETDLAIERVSAVCSKSKMIKRNAKEKEFWCTK